VLPRMNTLDPNPTMLFELLRGEMPFGRYAGWKFIDLPEPYVVWFRKEGFPDGHLGELLGLLYEIKLNGLESMVRKLAKDGHSGTARRPRQPTRR
jgi:uncharacterized protein (DUF3820 family)